MNALIYLKPTHLGPKINNPPIQECNNLYSCILTLGKEVVVFLFYESEIEEEIIKALKTLYNLKNESALLNYTYIRFKLFHKEEPIEKIHTFIIEELSLKVEDGKFSYKDYLFETYNLSILFSNVYKIIKDGIEIVNGKPIKWPIYIRNISEVIEKEALKSTKNYKHYIYFEDLYVYFKLKALNEIFGAEKQSDYIELKKFEQTQLYDKPILFESRCQRYLEDIAYATNHLLNYKEKDVENILIRQLDSIEKGLIFVGKQVPIKDGFIDILAKDKNDQYVVIEIKIKDDERLIWQCIYYPLQLKLEKNIEKVRTIVIAPSYSYKLKKALGYIGNCELFTFKPIVEKGVLKTIKLHKEVLNEKY